MNEMKNVQGEEVVINGGEQFVNLAINKGAKCCEQFVDLAINNGAKLGKKVVEVAPTGAVLGFLTGALFTMALASKELYDDL